MQLLPVLAALLSAALPFEAQTLDGAVVGQLTQIDGSRLTLDTATGPVVLPSEKLLRLSPQEAPATKEASPVQVELTDGSSLGAADFAAHDGRARINLEGDRAIELPVGGVSAVRLKPKAAEVADEWGRILTTEFDADVLVVRKGDALDYHHGVLHDVTDSVVNFELDGDVLPVKRTKVYGLIYYRIADEAPEEAICEVLDTDGSRWSASSLSMPSADELQFATPAGATVTRPLAELVQIDFSRGKVVYLSDLEPQSVTFTPYFGKDQDLPLLGRFFAPRRDTNFESAPLQIGDRQFAKGLAIHSRTEIVYRLPDRYRRFQAVAGIDDAVRPLGAVRLVVRGDDEVLLTADLCGSDPPRPIDLDVGGVRRITILVESQAAADVADHLDLGDARVIK